MLDLLEAPDDEIARLDETDLEPAGGGVERGTDARDAATDDEQVKAARRHPRSASLRVELLMRPSVRRITPDLDGCRHDARAAGADWGADDDADAVAAEQVMRDLKGAPSESHAVREIETREAPRRSPSRRDSVAPASTTSMRSSASPGMSPYWPSSSS